MSDEEDAPPATKPSLLKMSVSWGGLGEVFAFLALTATWLGSLGRLHWALDLLSHFRLQYFIVCALVLVFALVRRRVWLILAALVSLLWNAQLIYAVHQTAVPPATAPAQKPLRVMIFNVFGQNENHVAAVNHVLEADADIVCLLETCDDWRASLEPLRVKYPHRVEEFGQGNFSIACYTRLPLKSSEVRLFSPLGLPTILLNLDHLGTPLTFIGTHPVPPMGPLEADAWIEQLTEISALVAGIEGDVILGGDLNATPWCQGTRILKEKGGLGYRSTVPVWPPTWGRNLPMTIPIDHVLIKGPRAVISRTIGPAVGSDHRSVVVEIVR